ncbi:MAG: hypothetical protein ACLP1Q_14460 [Solirubrobacteraceae bacterium]
MMRKLAGGIKYANVTSTIALFVALGGASYAAITLPRDSVGSAQIRAHAVTAGKIARGAVTRALSAGTAEVAANASAIEGVGLSGLLRSNRIVSGAAPLEPAGAVVLRDERVGLEVLTGGSTGRLVIVNTNKFSELVGEGLGYYASAAPTPTSFTIGPGERTEQSYDATSFTYGQYTFLRQGDLATAQLSCLERTLSAEFELACVAVG